MAARLTNAPVSNHSSPWPQFVTTKELAKITAGGVDYIRTKHNVVKGLALVRKLNPGAPNEILFGRGTTIVKRARRFLESQAVVPAYIKKHTNLWEFFGEFRANEIRSDQKTIREHAGKRPISSLGGVLFLRRVDEPEVRITGGGFPDPELRKQIEQAAVRHVFTDLEKQGFAVTDHQRLNLGYDLLGEKGGERLLVEVKGTDCLRPRFYLSRNELKCSELNSNWRLYVVCEPRITPVIHKYTALEMRGKFKFDPLAWECTASV